MSRLALALCAVVVATTPRVALPHSSFPDHIERPPAYSHVINAVLGDLSFYVTYGTPPPTGTDADLRVRTHLEFVYTLLSNRDVSAMPADLQEARRHNLARLREYIDAGRFPRNHLYPGENRPCFIDREERICAVGYLVERSAGRKMAERINEEFQSEFLWRMRLPELDRWIAGSGLSLLELSMIQPCYDPRFNVQVTQDSGRAPATVSIAGYVYDECGCNTKVVVFDFGDGDGGIWTTGEVNLWIVQVNAKHIYAHPGVYTITGVAVGAGDCEGMTGSKTWVITLTTPEFTLVAVQVPAGPPYGVYLSTTDDIRLDYLSKATVEWGDGAPTEAAGWYRDGDSYRTPVHLYPSRGRRKIVVTHSYGGPPHTFSEVSSVRVDAGSAPTEPSSWGRIKALFALGG